MGLRRQDAQSLSAPLFAVDTAILSAVQRYGSHGVEFAFPVAKPVLAFITVLSRSTIEVYPRVADGSLTHLESSAAPAPSGRRGGGWPSAGQIPPQRARTALRYRALYVAFCPLSPEFHLVRLANYLDVYTITPPSPQGTAPILTYMA